MGTHKERFSCHYEAQSRQHYHLRQADLIKRKQEKEARKQKERLQQEETYRQRRKDEADARRQQAELHMFMIKRRKDELYFSTVDKYIECLDVRKKWNYSIFSHLSPSGREMDRLMSSTLKSDSMERLERVKRTVDDWASAHSEEIDKMMEIINGAVREWNLFFRRSNEVEGWERLVTSQNQEQLDTCESLVDHITEHRYSLDRQEIVTAASRIKELLDRVGAETMHRKNCVHPGISCDNCGEYPIRGKRLKCAECCNYDLCEDCYQKDTDHSSHLFLLTAQPGSDPVALTTKRGPLAVCNLDPDSQASLQCLYKLSVKTDVDFRELVDYAVFGANDEEE